MSGTTSTNPPQGFSVFQSALGAPLQFLPAVGTKELEQLIDAYLPGPASPPEKRASISMDFFEHSGQTGENFKYYAVYTPVATPESASSSSSSSFNVSPVMSDLSFYSSPSQASTPITAPAAKKARVASRKPTQERSDFSHLPGMKILTKDGTDVTNSVSRGCKSKEQRDHAHLMRILKACDACKKKKIRCDPSHKKRTASQLDSESKSEATKPVKKTRKTTSTPVAKCTASTPTTAEKSFHMDDIGLSADFSAPLDESWEQFLTFNDEPAATIPQDFYGAIPQDFDFFFGAENYTNFSPSASGSSVSPVQPVTPVGSFSGPQIDDFTAFGHNEPLAFLQSEDNSQEPGLPYLNPAGQHGSNYVDFNLFSPSSSFIDEEPKLLKSGSHKRGTSASPAQNTNGLNAPMSGTGLLGDQEWRFDESHFTLSHGEPEWLVPGGQVASARQQAARDGKIEFYGGSLPYHANDAGHNGKQSVNALARLQGLESTCRKSPVATTDTRSEHILGSTGLSSSSAATIPAPVVSRVAIPQVVQQHVKQQGTGNAHVTSQVEHQVLDSERRRRVRTATNAAVPLSAMSTVVASSPSSGSLSPAGLLTGGVQVPNNLLVARSSNGPSQTVVSGIGVNHPAESLHSDSGSRNVNAAPTVLCQGYLSQGLLRPAANNALRSLEMLLTDSALLSNPPVRQLLASSTGLSQLVAFGLVSLLMVTVMSILLMQTQTPILANLPITSVILLSLLSKVSAHQCPRAKTSGGAIHDSIRSTFRSTVTTCRQSRPTWASSIARVPLLSCV
ncbi:hypothetical protein VP1G_09714 [Cytospora mali]|uniref:Zn(2)-C6 fungal-type domain-containing protein n=1 Tax=Cytospora mali TaxID=578113 RepID=A0A194VEZ6_CYTMA|nr:hypothetical protein VP1G_09714 [Valsa mali var. pyri (nom. inval.)]